MQPSGVVTSLQTGAIGDMALSPDGKTLYVARDGAITAYSVASGAKLSNWAIGVQLGGIDVSVDGKYLVATERKIGPSTGEGNETKGEVYVYRLNLTTGVSEKYTAATTGLNVDFHDVSFLPNGSALLTRYYYGAPTILDFATGKFTLEPETRSQGGTQTATPDKTHIAIMQMSSSDAPVFVYEAGKGIVASHLDYADNVMGYNHGAQAISANGQMIAQGAGLNIYDGDLKMIVKLGERYLNFGGVTGLAFSPAGDKLYVLSSQIRQVLVFETRTWSIVAGYQIEGAVTDLGNYGDSLLITPDGKKLALAGASGVQMFDLTRAVIDGSTDGDDALTGDGGPNYIFGFGGNDSLDGKGGGDNLFGGSGNDTYYVHSLWDYATEYDGEGDDLIIVDVNGYTLPYHVETLKLAGAAEVVTGNDQPNTIIGTDLKNQIFGAGGDDRIEGNGGDDLLDGGPGNDTLIGGKGDDTYVVDSPADVVVERAGEGADTVTSAISYVLGDNLENLVLRPGTETLAGTGNALANSIVGNAGDNILIGLGGADVLRGGDGADTLDGGAGGDRIDGGAGLDVAIFDGKRSDYQVVMTSEGFRIIDTRARSDVDFVSNVETFRFADGDLSAAQLRDGADKGVSDWRLFAGDGFIGAIDAGGTVVGSLAKQDITVLTSPGRVIFDSSFNRGGDVIRLSGAASEWTVAREGSNAVFKSGDTSIVAPLGLTATVLVFTDGARNLRIDASSQSPQIGGQTITSTFTSLHGAADGPAPDPSGDDAARARLFLEAGGDASISGDFSVIGTSAREMLIVLTGDVRLDSSFNQGGDTVTLDAPSSAFTAVRSGSNAVFDSATIDLAAPAGATGMTLGFDDGERLLRIDQSAGAILIGQQALTLEPAPLAIIA